MKTISVIIPFFSGRELLQEAIDSVLCQTYAAYEIILVNDGSSEDISNILVKYPKLQYIYKKNGGAASARNVGIIAATGDYIAFLDSDDVWMPDKLERQLSFMELAGVAWSHTGFYYWFPDTGECKLVNNDDDYGDVRKKSYVTMKVATPSVMVRRDVFEHNLQFRFPEDFRNGEDTQFYRMLANKYPLGLVSAPLLKVRMRGNNSYRLAVSRFETNAKAFKLYRNNPYVPLFAKGIMSIYSFYHILLGSNSSPIKEKIASLMWVVPYVLERLYARYLLAIRTRELQYRV